MEWQSPTMQEVTLGCEINSYAVAVLPAEYDASNGGLKFSLNAEDLLGIG